MSSPLLVRDVMRIGVPTCKLEDTVAHVAALMIDGGHTAVIVLDEEADTRGWVNEHILAAAYQRAAAAHEDAAAIAIQDVMDEDVPECASDLPLAAAVGIMADLGVDHLLPAPRRGPHVAGVRAEPARCGENAGRAGISQESGDARRTSDADGFVPAASWSAEQTLTATAPDLIAPIDRSGLASYDDRENRGIIGTQ